MNLWRWSIAVLLCTSCSGTTATHAEANSCEVIVQFIPAVRDAADARLLSELSKQAGAPLRYARALGGDQHLMSVSLSDPLGCDRAVTALKRDSRVILAQIDTRKRAHH